MAESSSYTEILTQQEFCFSPNILTSINGGMCVCVCVYPHPPPSGINTGVGDIGITLSIYPSVCVFEFVQTISPELPNGF